MMPDPSILHQPNSPVATRKLKLDCSKTNVGPPHFHFHTPNNVSRKRASRNTKHAYTYRFLNVYKESCVTFLIFVTPCSSQLTPESSALPKSSLYPCFFFQTSCQPLPFKPLKEHAEEIGRRKDVGSDPYDPSSTYVNT